MIDSFGQLGSASHRLTRGLAEIAELEPGRVLLLLGIVERAGDPRVTHVYPPYGSATPIAPGRGRRGKLELPLPLCEWSQWHRPRRDAGLEQAVVDTLVSASGCCATRCCAAFHGLRVSR